MSPKSLIHTPSEITSLLDLSIWESPRALLLFIFIIFYVLYLVEVLLVNRTSANTKALTFVYMYGLFIKCEVQLAGYWSSSFLM